MGNCLPTHPVQPPTQQKRSQSCQGMNLSSILPLNWSLGEQSDQPVKLKARVSDRKKVRLQTAKQDLVKFYELIEKYHWSELPSSVVQTSIQYRQLLKMESMQGMARSCFMKQGLLMALGQRRYSLDDELHYNLGFQDREKDSYLDEEEDFCLNIQHNGLFIRQYDNLMEYCEVVQQLRVEGLEYLWLHSQKGHVVITTEQYNGEYLSMPLHHLPIEMLVVAVIEKYLHQLQGTKKLQFLEKLFHSVDGVGIRKNIYSSLEKQGVEISSHSLLQSASFLDLLLMTGHILTPSSRKKIITQGMLLDHLHFQPYIDVQISWEDELTLDQNKNVQNLLSFYQKLEQQQLHSIGIKQAFHHRIDLQPAQACIWLWLIALAQTTQHQESYLVAAIELLRTFFPHQNSRGERLPLELLLLNQLHHLLSGYPNRRTQVSILEELLEDQSDIPNKVDNKDMIRSMMKQRTGIRLRVTQLNHRIAQLLHLQSTQNLRIGCNNTPFKFLESSLRSFPSKSLLMWGKLGSFHSSIPKLFQPLKQFVIVQIACGFNHAIVLGQDGCIFTWGGNKEGQAGAPPCSWVEQPVQLKRQGWKVGCGNQTSFFVTAKGDLYGFGNKQLLGCDKQLVEKCYEPNRSSLYVKVKELCCGAYHTLALSKADDLYGWGSSEGGQLCSPEKLISLPKIIPTISKIKCMAAGEAHNIMLDQFNEVWVWGYGGQGQLGLQNLKVVKVYQMQQLHFNQKIVDVAAGAAFSLVRTQEGSVYGFGMNDSLQTGVTLPSRLITGKIMSTRLSSDIMTPQRIRGLQKVKCVGAGMEHGLASGNGNYGGMMTMSWGKNREGELGYGRMQNKSGLGAVPRLNGIKIKKLAGGEHFSLAIVD